MQHIYKKGISSWILKEEKMKLNQIILGSGEFRIEVRDTKTGKEFELPIVTGLFTKNDYDKEIFCYVPVHNDTEISGEKIDDSGYNAVFQIMTFLNEKSSDEEVTVMNCGGHHYTGEKIIDVLRHLVDERYSNMISGNYSNVKSFDYFKDGISSDICNYLSLPELFGVYRWQPVKAKMTYYPSSLKLSFEL